MKPISKTNPKRRHLAKRAKVLAQRVLRRRRLLNQMKRYFITGLLIWIPLVITVWVIALIVSTLDQSLNLLPKSMDPRLTLGLSVPGYGTLLTLTVIFITGVLAANFMGQKIVRLWEKILSRIPIVSSVYGSVKQVSDTLFSQEGNAFRKALLVEYPRRGAYTIAFLTGTPSSELLPVLKEKEQTDDEWISVYVPTTPNPTSGFFLMMPKSQTFELTMSVDEALKYIISMGVVSPPTTAFCEQSQPLEKNHANTLLQ